MMPVLAEPGEVSLDWLLQGLIDLPDVPALTLRGLCHDSRAVQPGDLFIALAGSRVHGLKHATAAVAAGAHAILYDPAGGGHLLAHEVSGVPCLPVFQLDQKLGFLADRFYGEPSRSLEVIGITGTNGKTSCSHFLAHALNHQKPAAVIGTLGWGVPGKLRSTTHTTPDAIGVHAVLRQLCGEGFKSVAMEASSHGLVQGRLNGVRLRGGLFTNLSRDHLDYHGTMEAYLEAKLRLVSWPNLEFMAFNLDDASAGEIINKTPVPVRRIGFTRKAGMAVAGGVEVLAAESVRHSGDGIEFMANYRGQRLPVSAPVFGDFNVENLLGVLAVLLGLGFSLFEATRRLTQLRAVPGRMERFHADGRAAVVVDYAHTPDALEKALEGLKQHCCGQLWVVFGCGGDRDRGKRPQMGAIAEALADRVILTDDNPRYEEGDAIVAEILGGCQRKDIEVIRDRRAAIAHALQGAMPEDVILVAGKGHENTQEIAGVKHLFSDRAEVEALLQGSSRQGGADDAR